VGSGAAHSRQRRSVTASTRSLRSTKSSTSGRSPLAERPAGPGRRSGKRGERSAHRSSRQRLDVGRREAGELECALLLPFRVSLRIELRVRGSTGRSYCGTEIAAGKTYKEGMP
jgi:hypothetical protein